ncbi:ATP-binding cassette domain-containing protein [Mycoplasmopsis sturni]|uniref:ATP-binding cassette domain-containing protein n=1 Tax=Mycoplasmopsis sturni TaxID=39047 RepID=UPI00055CD2FB|nr:ATP-binding cassette domain-containing protein [Mycoplasmopsis sturni]
MKKINAIEFVNVSKHFGEIKANQNISFEVVKGSIHALIGENGAGKSTLMSILFGLYQPDKGHIKVNGKEVIINGPNDANKLGIGMVHQHFKLVDVYTNLENIILGDEPYNKNTRTIDKQKAIKKIKAIQETFNLYFDLNNLTGKETVATQQKVEIMKMLYRDSDILIFDEPTAVLTDEEIQGLLNTFKLFKKEGKTIIFISHKLLEVKEVADNATVIRHGEVKGNFNVASLSIPEIASLMVGGDVEVIKNQYSDSSNNDVILKISNVSTIGEKSIKNFNLDIRSGEIVAIAGVEGNGQTDLEYAISGMKEIASGKVLLKKTQFVKQKFAELDKINKIKKISFLVLSILFLISSIPLFAINSTNLLNNSVQIVYGIILVIFGFVLGTLFIKQVFGSRIKSLYLDGKIHYEKLFNKKELTFQKIMNHNTLILLSLIFIIFLIGISTKLFDNYYTIFGGISLGLGILSFIFILLNFAIYHKKVKMHVQLKNKKIINDVLIYSVSVLSFFVLFFSAIIIGRQAIKILGILTTIFSFLLLLIFWIMLFIVSTSLIIIQRTNKNNDYVELNDLNVFQASQLGLSYIPSDRHKHGLALDYSIKENTVLRRLWDKKYTFFGIFKDKVIKQETLSIIDKYDVRGARNGISKSRSLSGGNQQKFIVGREMETPHDFILIVQPTRGLDVGAIKNIHERIIKEKQAGKAILLISYELDEVFALADRIAVINEGQLVTIQNADKLTRTDIGVYMANKQHKGGVSE